MEENHVEKFSKESLSIREIKEDFFLENKKLLDEAISINKFYISQKKRKYCKNCGEEIKQQDFVSFGVPYSICEKCGHVNGMYEDSEEFVRYLYADDQGDNYKKAYLKNYEQRVKSIYLPKVEFLSEVVGNNFSVRDVGCGGGHFLRACELKGIKAEGIDTSQSLIELGKSKLHTNTLELGDIKSFEDYIENSTSVVSMIGVLEHLRTPNKAIEAFKRSEAKYLYISVPLFGLSVFIEHVFPDVFPRHLRGPHTHLYTKESLKYLEKKHDLKIIGEWWFGLDIMDLYRSVCTQTSGSERFTKSLKPILGDNIDELQHVLDKNKVCSEVHLVFSK